MEYKLFDIEGNIVASVGGTDLLRGKMGVVYPTLWWPIGISDRPGHMYTLKVTFTGRLEKQIYSLTLIITSPLITCVHCL